MCWANHKLYNTVHKIYKNWWLIKGLQNSNQHITLHNCCNFTISPDSLLPPRPRTISWNLSKHNQIPLSVLVHDKMQWVSQSNNNKLENTSSLVWIIILNNISRKDVEILLNHAHSISKKLLFCAFTQQYFMRQITNGASQSLWCKNYQLMRGRERGCHNIKPQQS